MSSKKKHKKCQGGYGKCKKNKSVAANYKTLTQQNNHTNNAAHKQ